MPDSPAPDTTASEPSVRTSGRLKLLLKTRGTLSTKQLAQHLLISVPAVRQHLRALADEVQMQLVSNGVGRPAQMWSLSAAGHRRFPDTHAELTVRLLDSVEETLGANALEQLIDAQLQRQLTSYGDVLADAPTLEERLHRLVDIRCTEGYMAELQPLEDGWLLVEHHCPVCAAATRCRGFCRNELELFRQVLGVAVTRVEYLLEGGQRCAYNIADPAAG